MRPAVCSVRLSVCLSRCCVPDTANARYSRTHALVTYVFHSEDIIIAWKDVGNEIRAVCVCVCVTSELGGCWKPGCLLNKTRSRSWSKVLLKRNKTPTPRNNCSSRYITGLRVSFVNSHRPSVTTQLDVRPSDWRAVWIGCKTQDDHNWCVLKDSWAQR